MVLKGGITDDYDQAIYNQINGAVLVIVILPVIFFILGLPLVLKRVMI